jgi:hypothetical protein
LRASGGDPAADLERSGPQRIGRFALHEESWLEPLSTQAREARTGTWDVLAHPNGRIYFTTFFETAGYVEPRTGRVRRFDGAGPGLNELALLPDGRILASRYAPAGAGDGSVVILDEEGRVQTEHPLRGPPGWRVAAKSVAFDPLRREIWITTDLLASTGDPARHDARVLDLADGSERNRIEDREVQFVAFSRDGAAALVERWGSRLSLRVRAAGSRESPAESRRVILLDEHFPAGSDFAQDLRFSSDGAAVVTRWSGRIHVVEPQGGVRTLELPRSEPAGLYYTAVLFEDRLCSTYCAGLTVVCAPAP